MGAAEKPCAKRRFADFLGRKGLRLTAQRRVIIEVVFSTHRHFTAEQLVAWSRRRDPRVSRATVYRTLPLLTASGLVRELDFGKDCKVYDPNAAEHPNHSHLICQDCERVVEFESERITRLADAVSRQLGFALATHRLQLTGACEELRSRGSCQNQKAAAHRATSPRKL